MNLTKQMVRALLASSAIAALAAAPASAETLQEAMAMAYQGNPNILAARAQLRATDEQVPIAISGWRPTLTVNGVLSRNRNETIITGSTGAGAVNTSGTTLRTQETVVGVFSQPLFRGFKTVAGTAQANDQVMAQRARLQATEAAVLLQVATTYFDVLEYQAVVDLNRNQVQVLGRQLEATNDRFRVGEITRTDVAQSEASLAGARAALVQAEGLLQQARSAYENVVGKAPENLTQPALPGNLPATLDLAVSTAVAENPNYVAADFTAKAADENITVVRGDLLPSVSVVGQYTKAWNTVANTSQVETVIGQAQVNIPLYQAGAEYARLRQAKHLAGQSRSLADQAKLDARNLATTAWESFQSNTAQNTSYASQISANEIALEGTQREAEVGSRTVLDVLNAEQILLNSRVNLVRSQHDQAVAAHQLLSAMGALTVGDLGLNVPAYDPVAHYNDVKYKFFGSDAAADADAAHRPVPADATAR